MKRLILIVLYALFLCGGLSAQSINADKTNLVNFIQRMYKHSPFDIKLVKDYESTYLVSVVVLDPAKYGGSESTMQRVASVKAMSQASRFLNGSKITDDIVITTSETDDGQVTTEMVETLVEKSIGYVNALEQFVNFTSDDEKRIFIYGKKID